MTTLFKATKNCDIKMQLSHQRWLQRPGGTQCLNLMAQTLSMLLIHYDLTCLQAA